MTTETEVQAIYDENKEAFKSEPSLWLELAEDIWRKERSNEVKVSGQLLALINEKQDILTLASNIIDKEPNKTFSILHVIGGAFQYLENINLDALVKLCISQYNQTKNDMMSGILYNDIEPVLINRVEHCRALHNLFLKEPRDEIQGLYQVALSVLIKTEPSEAIKLLQEDMDNSNSILQRTSSWAAGLLLSRGQVPNVELKSIENALLRNITSNFEDVRNASIQVAVKCLKVTKAFDSSLQNLVDKGNQVALCAIAETFFLNFDEMKDKPNFDIWVNQLCQIDSEHKGGIDNFDYVLSYLIEKASKEEFAIELLTQWVLKNGQSVRKGDLSVVKLFDSTIHAICQNRELISKVITDWYLADEQQLVIAATYVLDEMTLMKIRDIGFNPSCLDTLNQNDIVLLARRVIGYVSNDEYLFSLVNSLLDTKDAKTRVFGIVQGLFINELGEDYPSSMLEFLNSAKAEEPDSDKQLLYSHVTQAIKDRINELDSLPRLSELQSNSDLERKFFSARAKQMNAAMEKANKGSIVEMIATRIPIKAGLGTFSHREGRYSEPSYLQSFSTSMSIPRRTVTDEVGLEIQSFMMRQAKRGDK